MNYIFNFISPESEPPISFQCDDAETGSRILDALGDAWHGAEVVAGPEEGPQFQGKAGGNAFALFIRELPHHG